MRFSIIIPIYNVEKYLAQCLESILTQDYNDYEIICIEDQSTDKSADIMECYAKRNKCIRRIYNEENRGAAYSRNQGIVEARGEYIWFVDSDDWIREGALKRLDEILVKHPCDAVHFDFIEKYEESEWDGYHDIQKYEIQERLTPISGREFFFDTFRRERTGTGVPCIVWSAVWSTAFLASNKLYFEEGLLHEDVLFSFKQSMIAKKVIAISDSLYVYRRRDGSISSFSSVKHKQSMFHIIMQIFLYWERNCFSEEEESLLMIFLIYIYRTYMTHFALATEGEEPYLFGDRIEQFFYRLFHGEVYSFEKFNSRELELLCRAENVWIYGAGRIGMEVARYFQSIGQRFEGFVVSEKGKNPDLLYEHEVWLARNVRFHKKDVVVISVQERYVNNIMDQLDGADIQKIFLRYR